MGRLGSFTVSGWMNTARVDAVRFAIFAGNQERSHKAITSFSGGNMQHKALSNKYYLEGKVAYLENKHECPYQPGPQKGMWLAGVAEMREELRVLRESLQLQARA